MAEEKNNIITNAIDFWQTLFDEKEANIKFVKKDNSVRLMRCTLDFTKIPKVQQPKTLNMAKIIKLMRTSGVIRVYDLDKKDWRSVSFNKVEWMKTPTGQYKIKHIK